MLQEDFLTKYRNSSVGISDYKGRILETVCYQSDSKKGIISLDSGLKKDFYFPERLCDNYYEEEPEVFGQSSEGSYKTFFLNQIETPDGDSIVNIPKKRRYNSNERWEAIESCRANGRFVLGRLLNTVKGGFSIGVGGFVAFLPNSQLLKGKSPSLAHWSERIRPYIGSVLAYRILKTDFMKRNIILSRTAVLRFAKKHNIEVPEGY